MKWTKKWTQEERNAGIQLTEELMVAAERITIACAYNDAAIELACQRNALRDALKKAERCLTELYPSDIRDAEHVGEFYAVNKVLNEARAALLKSGGTHE